MTRAFSLIPIILSGLMPLGSASAVDATTRPSITTQVEAAQARVRVLLEKLDAISSSHDPIGQHHQLEIHWAELGDLFPEIPRGRGSASCALPPEMDSRRYIQDAKDLLWELRGQLVELHGSDASSRALRKLAIATDRDLRVLRGRSFRRGAVAPIGSDVRLPDAASEGAYVVRSQCTRCHGAPQPALHDAAEWGEVMAKMETHSGIADMIEAEGVHPFSDRSLRIILSYLSEHACRPVQPVDSRSD